MTANGTRVDVDGAETFRATMAVAGKDLEDMAPPPVGDLIRDRARAHAPFVSGALRASLTAETEPGRVSVGSPLPYAGVVHNGWSGHNIAANPYLIPVAEDLQSVWGAYYVAEANRVVSHVRGA